MVAAAVGGIAVGIAAGTARRSCITAGGTTGTPAGCTTVICELVLRLPFSLACESFDIGVDTRYGVDDNDYQVPFPFTGKLDKLTIKLVPLSAAEDNLLKQKIQQALNAAQ